MRRILPTYSEKTIARYVVLYPIIGLLIFAVGKQIFTKVMLNQCFRLTVAITTAISGGYKTRNTLHFIYKVDGKQYEGGYGLGNGNFTEQVARGLTGRRFYVQFSCAHPNLSRLLYDREVPGSVVTIPPDGWDKIPQ